MTSNAVAKRDQNEQLRSTLVRIEDKMGAVLPRHLTPERMITLALVAATKTPELYRCTPESIMLAMLRVAQWGLEIGTTAHLVPFNTKIKINGREEWQSICTPIADYKGLMELVKRSGDVRDIFARAVYANEHFLVRHGLDEALEHHPIFGSTKGELVAVYAIAYLKHGRATWEVMGKDEVDRIRNGAKSKDSPAWRDRFDEMAKKTVIRRLCKRLPQSAVLADALGSQEIPAAYDMEAARLVPQSPQTRRFLPPEPPEPDPQEIAAQQDAAAEQGDEEPNYEDAPSIDELPELPLQGGRQPRGRNAVAEGR